MSEPRRNPPTLSSRFESLLWRSRLVVVVAVIASLVVSLAMFYVATVDVVALVGHLGEYHTLSFESESRADFRSTVVAHVVEVVDGYLVAAIMLIFALGLYELFVSRIEAAESSDLAERLLLIRSLDDLKDRLAKLVLLILVVKFFEFALTIDVANALDLLWLGLGIMLVAAAVTLTSKGGIASR